MIRDRAPMGYPYSGPMCVGTTPSGVPSAMEGAVDRRRVSFFLAAGQCQAPSGGSPSHGAREDAPVRRGLGGLRPQMPSPRHAAAAAESSDAALYPRLPKVFAPLKASEVEGDKDARIGEPTHLDVFDLELRVLLQCLERVKKAAPGTSPRHAGTGRADGRAAGTVLRGMHDFGEQAPDPLTLEINIIQKALEKMQGVARKLVRENKALDQENKELAMNNAALVQDLREEKDRVRALTRAPYGAAGGPRGVDYSAAAYACARRPALERERRVSTSGAERSYVGGHNYGLGGLDLLDAGQSSPKARYSRCIPQALTEKDVEAMGLGVQTMLTRQPRCFWSTLVRHLFTGTGNYRFIVDTSNPLRYRRLPLAREAAAFGLDQLVDTMFLYHKPTIDIKRLHPDPTRLRPVKKTQMNLGCAPRERGIISFLGTMEFQKPFVNPALDNGSGQSSREIVVGASSSWGQASPLSISEERLEFFCTQNHPNQWVSVDLLDVVAIPCAYSVVSFHPILAGYYPRHWVFEASIDGKNWAVLRTHTDDESLSNASPYCRFALECPEHSYYRCFRLRQTGPNSFGTDELQISSVEIFGDILMVGKFANTPAPIPPPLRHINTTWNDAWCLPSDKAKAGGKKKK